AVHGDGSLGYDVTHQFRRRCDVQDAIGPGALPAHDAAGAIDVAGHEMAVEPAVGAQRTFEVHQPAGARELKIRPPPRLVEDLEAHELPGSATGDFDGGQATAVHRHAVAALQPAATGLHLDHQPNRLR